MALGLDQQDFRIVKEKNFNPVNPVYPLRGRGGALFNSQVDRYTGMSRLCDLS